MVLKRIHLPSLSSVPVRKHVDIVSKLDPCITNTLLESELFNGYSKVTIKKMVTRHPSYSSFRVLLPAEKFDIVLDPTFWPNGVLQKLISSCLSISPPLIDVHVNNNNSNDYCLCSDLCNCNQVILDFYQNYRGLRTKLCILKCNVALFDYMFICLIETWICDSFHDSELGLTNYTIYRCNRSSLTSSFF
jgi:hypothetical protein